jgi:hypothetical protein
MMADRLIVSNQTYSAEESRHSALFTSLRKMAKASVLGEFIKRSDRSATPVISPAQGVQAGLNLEPMS